MKVSAILKGEKDSLGRQMLKIRIADGKVRQFKSLDIRLHANDFEDGVVKKSHPDHKFLNLKIKEEILKAEKNGFTTESKSDLTFEAYAQQFIDRVENIRAEGTLRQYRSELNNWRKFRKGLPLEDVTTEVLRKYLAHIFAKGNEETTAWKSLKFVRTVIYRALDEKLIKDNPFKLFEMPKCGESDRQYLTDAELVALEGVLDKDLPPALHITAGWFLIGCYTGLRFGDMKAFDKKKNIIQGRLTMKTGKTGEVIGMPVNARLTRLFEAVNYKPYPYGNKYFNEMIKQVAGIAEIREDLSAHIARHTAAVRWANGGISMEVVGKLLGQTSLKTTAIYFKITNKRIDDELNKLD